MRIKNPFEYKRIDTGIVRGINNISSNLTMVTLEGLYEESEMTIPVYMNLQRGYFNKVVDITTERKGLLGQIFTQSVESSEVSSKIEIPYPMMVKFSKEIPN